jgi:hypothetical protein
MHELKTAARRLLLATSILYGGLVSPAQSQLFDRSPSGTVRDPETANDFQRKLWREHRADEDEYMKLLQAVDPYRFDADRAAPTYAPASAAMAASDAENPPLALPRPPITEELDALDARRRAAQATAAPPSSRAGQPGTPFNQPFGNKSDCQSYLALIGVAKAPTVCGQ